jgi:hypothetical protein
MLERTIKEAWTSEDVSELKSRSDRLKKDGVNKRPFYEQCQIWVQHSENRRQKARVEAMERGEELAEGIGEMVSYSSLYTFLPMLKNSELRVTVIDLITGCWRGLRGNAVRPR